MRKETLIEQRVLERAPAEVRAAYEDARTGKVIFKCWPDQLPMVTKGDLPVMKGPRIGEVFLDRVILGAGGRRLTEAQADANAERNAEYVIQEQLRCEL